MLLCEGFLLFEHVQLSFYLEILTPSLFSFRSLQVTANSCRLVSLPSLLPRSSSHRNEDPRIQMCFINNGRK